MSQKFSRYSLETVWGCGYPPEYYICGTPRNGVGQLVSNRQAVLILNRQMRQIQNLSLENESLKLRIAELVGK